MCPIGFGIRALLAGPRTETETWVSTPLGKSPGPLPTRKCDGATRKLEMDECLGSRCECVNGHKNEGPAIDSQKPKQRMLQVGPGRFACESKGPSLGIKMSTGRLRPECRGRRCCRLFSGVLNGGDGELSDARW